MKYQKIQYSETLKKGDCLFSSHKKYSNQIYIPINEKSYLGILITGEIGIWHGDLRVGREMFWKNTWDGERMTARKKPI